MSDPVLVGAVSPRSTNLGWYADSSLYDKTIPIRDHHLGRDYTIGGFLSESKVRDWKLDYAIPTAYTFYVKGKGTKTYNMEEERRVTVLSSCRRVAYFNECIKNVCFITATTKVTGRSRATKGRFEGIHQYAILNLKAPITVNKKEYEK